MRKDKHSSDKKLHPLPISPPHIPSLHSPPSIHPVGIEVDFELDTFSGKGGVEFGACFASEGVDALAASGQDGHVPAEFFVYAFDDSG